MPARLVVLVAALASLAPAASAQADTIYWNNYDAEPVTVGFAGTDGTGGGVLNLSGIEMDEPEGMAYDTATNRLFVASSLPGAGDDGQITAINLDGSGAANFTAPGAPIDEPEGITIDPVTRTVFWVNTGDLPYSIAWARLDGSLGGLLNTAGATVDRPLRLAVDPVASRVYWGNDPSGFGVQGSISFASVNNGGGGNLPIPGLAPESISGLSVDPAGGKIYYVDSAAQKTFFANLDGSGGGEVFTAGATLLQPFGLALDPTLGRLYWGNYGAGETRAKAFGTALVAGGGATLGIATAPLDSPQDPLIIKAPAPAGVPVVARASNDRSKLTCPTGSWGADFAGSFVYQAPRSFAYQWALNGKAISAATATTLSATKPGKYTCTVTATNQAGSAAQTSAAANVKASKAKLTTKKKATVKAGGTATFKVKIANQGDLKSKNAKLCVILSKASKGALKAPKCKSLGKLKGKGKKSTKLKIRALPSAAGVYSVSFKVKGSAGKAAKAKIVVNG